MTSILETSRAEKYFKIGLHFFYWGQVLLWLWALQFWAGEETSGYTLRWCLVSFPFKLAIFYSYFYFFIPRWLGKRNGYLIITTLVILIVYPPLKYFVDGWLGVYSLKSIVLQIDEQTSGLPFDVSSVVDGARREITVVLNILMAFFIRLMVDWFRNLRMRSRMEKLQLQSELAMLRNQVNPHFLFNTLNNIDAMVYKVSVEASEAIMKLSAIMRYMLYESNTDWVSLWKEAEYLESYFELQQLRFAKTNQVKLIIEMENPEVKIAPMIFIPFVENAFKHAIQIDNETFVHCRLSQHDESIELQVTNSFDPKARIEKDPTSGIGIQNVKRRLELIYADRHSLEVTKNVKNYLVNLTIKTDEN